MPSGSRAPISFLLVSATNAYAPSSERSPSMKRSTKRGIFDRATMCSITSVSEVDCMIAPSRTSWRRMVRAFVRLPLWAIAKPPASSSENSGCTLRRIVSPVVE